MELRRMIPNRGLLLSHLDNGYVRKQVHPNGNLIIFNYTEKTQFERKWDEVTTQCRGLIIDRRTYDVVARPFPKFFNYGEPDAGTLSMDEPVRVTDKMDGSLGILYFDGTDWAIATRGSFTSPQALHATKLLDERYANWGPDPGYTYLFEIIYQENRIVLDYGDLDALVFLGRVEIGTGMTEGPDLVWWPGPVAHTFEAQTLAEALDMPPRENAEGVVVHYFTDPSEKRVKIKQADYVALHRVMTGTNARTLWEFLAVNACKHMIDPAKPKHWGSKLKINPAKALEIVAIGDDWMSKMLKNVPDEFYAWVSETLEDLETEVRLLADTINGTAAGIKNRQESAGLTRAQVVQEAKYYRPEHWQAVLMALDNQDITMYCWVCTYPPAARPWQNRTEDTA